MQKKQRRSLSFLLSAKTWCFFFGWFGVFVVKRRYPCRFLFDDVFAHSSSPKRKRNFSTEMFFLVSSQNFSRYSIFQKVQNKKFSWIFNVLRAIERVGRPFCLERRFDWSVFWVFWKRKWIPLIWKDFFFVNSVLLVKDFKHNMEKMTKRCLFFNRGITRIVQNTKKR